MGWKDLIGIEEAERQIPWLGSKVLQLAGRSWTLQGRQPDEFGWYRFECRGRKAKLRGDCAAPQEIIRHRRFGYLVGDRFIADDARVDPNPLTIFQHSEPCFLVEEGLDRFVRVEVGRLAEDQPLLYVGQAMPLGPEEAVMTVFLDRGLSVDTVPGVVPALDAAFRMTTWMRTETERRRAEAERLQREEEQKRALKERRRRLVEQVGTAEGRRALARVDFEQAARAALQVGGADFLDHRATRQSTEAAVRFRLQGRRFECTCDKSTLRIIDSGVCLRDHETGEQGDTLLTLESLPGVILEAIRTGVLHVFRHVD